MQFRLSFAGIKSHALCQLRQIVYGIAGADIERIDILAGIVAVSCQQTQRIYGREPQLVKAEQRGLLRKLSQQSGITLQTAAADRAGRAGQGQHQAH